MKSSKYDFHPILQNCKSKRFIPWLCLSRTPFRVVRCPWEVSTLGYSLTEQSKQDNILVLQGGHTRLMYLSNLSFILVTLDFRVASGRIKNK
jgi:hypothetical protein